MKAQEAKAARARYSELFPKSRYFPVQDDGKAPQVKLKENPNLPEAPPKTSKYGAIPPAGVMVIDVDTHHTKDTTAQVAALSHLLGLDLRKTTQVRTASGGVHFYLGFSSELASSGIPNGSFRFYESYLREIDPKFDELLGSRRLDTDFKVGRPGVAHYVIGPGSYNSDGTGYSLIENTLLTLPDSKIQALIDLKTGRNAHNEKLRREAYLERRARAGKPERDRAPRRARDQSGSTRMEHEDGLSVIPKERHARIRTALEAYRSSYKNASEVRFHSLRAYLFQLARCCASDKAIAKLCEAMGVDRDTHRDCKLTPTELMDDIARMRAVLPDSEFHGLACGLGRFNSSAASTLTLAQGLEKLETKVVTRSLARRGYRVSRDAEATAIDLDLARDLMAGTLRRGTAQFLNGVRILREVVQPVLSSGGSRVVMSRAYLEEALELTPSQVGKAVSGLRRAGVLELADRQRTGVASTYTLAPGLRHEELSHLMTLERAKRRIRSTGICPSLTLDFDSEVIVETFTGASVYGDGTVAEELKAGAKRYSADEAEYRARVEDRATESESIPVSKSRLLTAEAFAPASHVSALAPASTPTKRERSPSQARSPASADLTSVRSLSRAGPAG